MKENNTNFCNASLSGHLEILFSTVNLVSGYHHHHPQYLYSINKMATFVHACNVLSSPNCACCSAKILFLLRKKCTSLKRCIPPPPKHKEKKHTFSFISLLWKVCKISSCPTSEDSCEDIRNQDCKGFCKSSLQAVQSQHALEHAGWQGIFPFPLLPLQNSRPRSGPPSPGKGIRIWPNVQIKPLTTLSFLVHFYVHIMVYLIKLHK